MEVKEVRSETPASDVIQNQVNNRPSVTSEAIKNDQPSVVSLAVNADRASTSEVHAHLNENISTINVIKDAADNLVRISESLQGVLEQGLSNELSESRRKTLENEAKSLAGEIQRVLKVQAPNGDQLFSTDNARVEIEARIGQSLNIIFPQSDSAIPDPTKIQLSPRDAIINTRANVEVTLKRFTALQESISAAHDRARQALDKVEVASENFEASRTTVRDLDSALELAQTTQHEIELNSKDALGSFSKLRPGAEQLLR